MWKSASYANQMLCREISTLYMGWRNAPFFFQLAMANITGCLTNIHSFQILPHLGFHVYLCDHVVWGR